VSGVLTADPPESIAPPRPTTEDCRLQALAIGPYAGGMSPPDLQTAKTAVMQVFTISKRAVQKFVDDDCPVLAASLAFYALFSFAPLIVVVVRVLGLVIAPDRVEALVVTRLDDIVGPAGAAQSREVLSAFERASNDGGWLATVLSSALSLFGATTVVVQLQTALDRAWNVKRKAPFVSSLLRDRLSSVLVIATIALLLPLSLIATSVISTLRAVAEQSLPDIVANPALQLSDVGLSWLVFAILFALLFKWMPRTRTPWRGVLAGAACTSALFVIGKQAIAWYLGQGATSSLYGAAGSLAALLSWVFYSALILLFGAELTQVLSERMRKTRTLRA